MRHWCTHHWWWANSWCSKCNYQIVSTSVLTIKYSVSSPPQYFFSPVLELVFLGFFCVWLWMGKAQPSKRHCWKRVEASVRTIGGVVMFWLKHNNPTRVVMFWPRIVVQTWGPGSPSVVSPPAWNNTLERSTNTRIWLFLLFCIKCCIIYIDLVDWLFFVILSLSNRRL